MSKPVDRVSKPRERDRGATRKTGRPTPATGAPDRAGSAGQADAPDLPLNASAGAQLARLLRTPHLERVVPHLAPETVHQLIRHHGLDACGELVASMAPAQLASVLDLDLWRSHAPAGDEQLDPERFGEWLEALVALGDAAAARIVAGIDQRLVIAGLSRHIRVLDAATGAGRWSTSDEAMDIDSAELPDLAGNVGGYAIGARRTDAWDAIVTLLVALDAGHRDYFHAVMRGCRRLSDEGREADGLDELLAEPEQLLYDLATERQDRRSRQGYLTPADARAFLQMARRRPHLRHDRWSPANPIASAYLQEAGEAAATAHSSAQQQDGNAKSSRDVGGGAALDAAVDALAEAGLAPTRPRALLEGGTTARQLFARVRTLMEDLENADEAGYLARNRELAFLANVLVAGCSVQARPFSAREAFDAAVATCNLGLDQQAARRSKAATNDATWARECGGGSPDEWAPDRDLVKAFEVGWAALHDMSVFVAERLIATLAGTRCLDRETQEGLDTLRRELVRQLDAGTPWRARDALDAIATLDGPAWAGLLGALDECPVLPAALTAVLEGRTGAVSPTAFEFISTTSQVSQVRAFASSLPDILLG